MLSGTLRRHCNLLSAPGCLAQALRCEYVCLTSVQMLLARTACFHTLLIRSPLHHDFASCVSRLSFFSWRCSLRRRNSLPLNSCRVTCRAALRCRRDQFRPFPARCGCVLRWHTPSSCCESQSQQQLSIRRKRLLQSCNAWLAMV